MCPAPSTGGAVVGLAPWMGVAPGLCAVEDSLGLSMEWPDIPALEGVQVDGRRDPDGAIDRGDPEESFENLEYLITFYLDGLPRLYNIFAAVAEYRRSRALTVPYLSVPSDGGPGKWELKPTEYVIRSEAHALKGTASNLSLKKLWRVARALELPCKRTDPVAHGDEFDADARRAVLDAIATHGNVFALAVQFRALAVTVADTPRMEAAMGGMSIAEACAMMGGEGDGLDDNGKPFSALYNAVQPDAFDALWSADLPLHNPFAGKDVWPETSRPSPISHLLPGPPPPAQECAPTAGAGAAASQPASGAKVAGSGSTPKVAPAPSAPAPASLEPEPIVDADPPSGGGCCCVQ